MKIQHCKLLPFLFLLCITTNPGALQAAIIESAMSGNWNLSSTWVGGSVPVADDDVIIKNTHNVTLSDTRPCTSITIEAGATLTHAGTLNNSSTFLNQGTVHWTSGTFAGAGSITNDGTLNINGFENHNTASNITNNAGKTINWNDGHLDQAAGGQTLTNHGTFNLISNPGGLSCKMAIVNTGAITKPAGGSSLFISLPFDNQATGLVTLVAGASLQFNTGGNLTQSGTFNVAGTLILNGGSHNFTTASGFGGTGVLNINGATTITAAAGFAPAFTTVTHAANLNAGASTALTIPSGTTWNWTSGDFGAFTSITNDGTLDINGFNNHNTAANVTNNAGKTINWNDGHLDQAAGGQTLTNHGTFNLIANPGGLGFQMAIVNTGAITKPAGGSSLFISLPFDNQATGSVTLVAGASLQFNSGGNLTQSGTFNVSGTLILNGGSHNFTAATGFGGAGALNISGTCTVSAAAGFAPAFATVTHSANLNAGGSTALTIPSGTTWNWTSGDFGAFTSISNDGTLNINGFQNHNTAANIINNTGGTINWNDGHLDQAAGGQTLTNNGVFNLIANPGGLSCQMAIINTGTVYKPANAGTLTMPQPFDNQSTGSIDGLSTISFSSTFTNTGLISPGASPGIIKLNRTAGLQVHDLAIEVASNTGAGTGHDQLQSANAVNIDGNLTVNLLGGFTPTYGAVYTIMTYASHSGSFASVTPDCWTVTYGATSTTITYEPDTWYADVDGDGYGNPAVSIQTCTPPSGYVLNSADCSDSNAAINPGMAEICNGLDDDCDGLTDDADPNVTGQPTWYADVDGDGYGDATVSQLACTQSSGYVANNTDCDDTNATIHPGAAEVCNGIDEDCDGETDEGVQLTFYADADADGYGDVASTTLACTAPSGFVSNNTDCDDTNAAIHPGATEVCNGIDEDCDGQIDEGVQLTFYADADGDGYGDVASTTLACIAPSGYVSNNTDCDDTNAAVHPGATEVCNGIDEDCDGETDEGVQLTFYADTDADGFGNLNSTILACTAPPGYVSDNSDCDDSDPTIHPGATEVCNNADDDCDGLVDEGVKIIFYADTDADGYGNLNNTILACAVPSGYVADNSDCNDTNAAIHPGAAELCNGLDDNCDGQAEEGLGIVWYADADGDDYGDPNVTTVACSAPLGYIGNNADCDDHDADINPGATEICNGIDDNCDGNMDEGLQSTFYLDADGDGYGDESNDILACFAPSGYVLDFTDCNDNNAAINPGAVEVCNGVDDNCDGQLDEGVQQTFFADTDGDGYGDINNSVLACSAPSGFVGNSTDCNDANVNINPGSTEVCNNLDDNCDGQIDEGNVCDGDGDGYTIAQGDCNDNNAAVYPGAAEICNSIDDNCNGLADENVGIVWYADTDDDGFGDAAVVQLSCSQPPGYVLNTSDCDDNNAAVHPGATEICNNIDDDCDGLIDETNLQITLSAGNILCTGGITTLTASTSNGISPYQYNLDGGAYGSNNSFTVGAGSHEVTVLDAHGCIATSIINILEPDAILIDPVVVTHVACNGGNTGAINITVNGGTPNYTYRWSNNKVTQDIANLAAGTYTVTVTDAHGCTEVISAIVNPRLKLIVSKTNVTCYGGSDGTATATVSGGNPGYTYLWNTGATTPTITDLVAGTYRVTISDALGCTRVSNVGVGQAALIGISGVVQHVTCNGYENGTIAISISHGVAPFTYLWNDGETTEDRTDLGPGSYTLLVTDVNGCTRERTFTITEYPLLTLSFSIKNVTCNGFENGEITATAAGGKKFPTNNLCNGERYCYQWSNGATSRIISDLAPSTYNLSVTDANGCLITGSVNITEPDSLWVTAVNQELLPNGKYKLTMSAIGGTTPYKYKRLPGTSYQSSNVFNNVPIGEYNMIVRDAKLCEDTLLVNVPNSSLRGGSSDSRDQAHEAETIEAQNEEGSATLFPNPAMDMFRISMGKVFISGDIRIFDLGGHLIVEQSLTTGISDYQFSITGWPGGIYLVQIQTEKGVVSLRLVVGMR